MRGFDIRWRKMIRTATAVVSDPAILNFVSCSTGSHRNETYICSIVSDSASSWVRPWRMKESNISFPISSAFGPNRLPTVFFAILQLISQLPSKTRRSYPSSFPKPMGSFSDGRIRFTSLVCSNQFIHGSTVTSIAAGRVSSIVLMYS